MKQLLQNLRTGETLVVEVPIPAPKPGMALIHTAASLVSAGTERTLVEFAEKSLLGKARSRPDLLRQMIDKARREGVLTTLDAATNRLDQPVPLGYSSAGIIAGLGAGVQDLRIGQRVACAGGNYAVHAEYEIVPCQLLTPLPDQVDFESAAFTTLGAIAMHGFRLAETSLGERVAIIGLGLLGMLCVEIAIAAGCPVLGIDLDPRRVELAQKLGAEAVFRNQAVEGALSFSRGRGCDAVFICADTPSADPVELAGMIARDRARVVAIGAVGLHIPRKIYYEKELSFINSRSYGPGRYDPNYEEKGQDYPIGYVRWTEGRNLEAFVDLLAAGRVDVHPLITHRYPIEQAPQAYELITGKLDEAFLGVILTYPDVPDSISQKLSAQPTFPARKSRLINTTSTPGKVTLGVLGAGNFATAVLLPALRKIKGVELVGVASGAGLSAQYAAQKYGFRYATSDENRILNDPQINTIAILTRHHLHSHQVLAAIRAGKHVFCEKPLAITHDQLNEISQQLSAISDESSGKTEYRQLVTVGFNRRFAPFARRLYGFIKDRKEPLVAHYRINAGYIPLNHWTQDPLQGGGRIIGEGCHFIDLLTFLVGELPLSVTAFALPDGGRYRQDNVVMTFTFADGSIGTVTYLANGDKAFPKEYIEVFCGGRVAVLNDYRSLELVQDGNRRDFHSFLRQDKGHRAEWEIFTAAIAAAGDPPIPYNHLIGVTQAAFSAIEALTSGEKILINPIRSV